MKIDGNALYSYGDGLTIAIISIITVFTVLLFIIFLTDLITKFVKEPTLEKEDDSTNDSCINDEDAIVACLVASIDYRNDVKKNIKVLNVKEVK